MSITNALVASGSATAIFTATSQVAITTIIFCNTTGATPATLDVYAVPYGSNAVPTTQIMKSVSIPPTETFVLDTERLILENGDKIFAQASVSSTISATISSLITA